VSGPVPTAPRELVPWHFRNGFAHSEEGRERDEADEGVQEGVKGGLWWIVNRGNERGKDKSGHMLRIQETAKTGVVSSNLGSMNPSMILV
jgi:hypothetical protein